MRAAMQSEPRNGLAAAKARRLRLQLILGGLMGAGAVLGFFSAMFEVDGGGFMEGIPAGWAIAATVILLGALAVAFWSTDRLSLGDRIAQIDIDGVIVNDQDRVRALQRIASDESVKALIVRIDSPGGTVVGGEELYRVLRQVSANKPVAATISGTGASAAYMIALAADRVFVRENSITGSIGVVLQSFDLTGAMEKLGVGARLDAPADADDDLPEPVDL
mgnify:CR=1 FL=1